MFLRQQSQTLKVDLNGKFCVVDTYSIYFPVIERRTGTKKGMRMEEPCAPPSRSSSGEGEKSNSQRKELQAEHALGEPESWWRGG